MKKKHNEISLYFFLAKAAEVVEKKNIFSEKKSKKTKFSQMIENVIASILSTGRPPNSDFSMSF